MDVNNGVVSTSILLSLFENLHDLYNFSLRREHIVTNHQKIGIGQLEANQEWPQNPTIYVGYFLKILWSASLKKINSAFQLITA